VVLSFRATPLRAAFVLGVLALPGAAFAQSDYATPYSFTTLAGFPSGSADGTGSVARFNNLQNLAVDSAGNLYVADYGNDTIRKITPAGDVTTLAGTAGQAGSSNGTGGAALFNGPVDVAVDSAGNVYVADSGNNRIRKVTPAGVVTTLAGSSGQAGSADGKGSAAQFDGPQGVGVDGAGNVYVADTNNYTIRKVTPAGDVTTLAGAAGQGGSEDGKGGAAQFNDPVGVAVDSSGNVYVADAANDEIRKVTPAGVVTTLAGAAGQNGSADGKGSAAQFNYPEGVAVNKAGTVFVADAGNDTIRKITPAGVVTTLVGAAGQNGSANGTGSAAQFNGPAGVAVDSAGEVFVADSGNDTVREVTSAGVVTTLAGAPSQGSADGEGGAAHFDTPCGVTADSAGNVYVADFNNSLIRKITPSGVVTTLAGLAGKTGGADGKGSAARFSYPEGVALDKAGNVYVADTGNDAIRKITPAGVVTTLAGTAGQGGSVDGKGAAARFSTPIGIALDSAGNVYVTARDVRKITPAGVVTTLAGTPGRGSANGTGSAAQFKGPAGLVVDSAGNVYVADGLNDEIRKVTPAGVVTTFAGTAGQSGSADGTGAAALFNTPCGIALDGAGNFYVADTNNDTIRKITPAGVVTTLAGAAGQGGSADGAGEAALFNGPFGVALDSAGNLYIGDSSNNTVRKGGLAAGPSISTQPKPATVTAGGNASFTVAASGSPAPTFEWQVSTNGGSTWAGVPAGSPYSGHNATTLTLSGATAAMSGYRYRCEVANSVASITSNAVLLTVNKAAQTISFTAPGNKTFGAAPFSLTATATSGLPVSFSIASGPATFSGGKVALTGKGTVKIDANQAGNANYLPAPTVSRSFTVN